MAMRPAVSDPSKGIDQVVDAIRSFQSQNDLWQLADALAKQIPNGTTAGGVSFGDIIDAANKEGVLGKLSAKSLQLYRDSALRWPADKRVAGVSFSAHREAQSLEGSVDDQVIFLGELIKNTPGGAAKVSVASVRAAVRVKQGKTATRPSAATNQQTIKVLDDLKAGAKELIATITSATSASDLDKLHAGLTKAISHVDTLRSRAAKAAALKASKASGGSRATNNPTPIASAKKAAGPIGGKRGDLRGL
jgi:hypothetical protein